MLGVSCTEASIENTQGWTQRLLQLPGYKNLLLFYIWTKSKKNPTWLCRKVCLLSHCFCESCLGFPLGVNSFYDCKCLTLDKMLKNFVLLIALIFLPSLTIAIHVTIRFIFTSINIYLCMCVHICAYIPSFSQLDRYSISHHESMLPQHSALKINLLTSAFPKTMSESLLANSCIA